MITRRTNAVGGQVQNQPEQVTVIEPRKGWRTLDWRELWLFRELLWVLAGRDFRVRYRQTLLGAGWAVARPLLTMAVFTLVFGRLAKMPSDGLPYAVFVYAGLLPWTFFAAAVAAAGASLLGSAHLITKVYFPRLILPLASLGAPLVDLLISTGVLFGLMAYYDVRYTPNLLVAPLLLLVLVATALGVGILTAALSVSYRDLQQLLPFVIQIWMFASPVIYPVSLFPERWRWVLFANPVTGLIEGFRSAFLGRPFDLQLLAISAGSSISLLCAAIAVFEKFERRFADLI